MRQKLLPSCVLLVSVTLALLSLLAPVYADLSCDDGDACTLDWAEQRTSATNEGRQMTCMHELVPPPCQLLMPSSAASSSSATQSLMRVRRPELLPTDGAATTARQSGVAEAVPANEAALWVQPDAALDVHVLLSVADARVPLDVATVQRLLRFVADLHNVTFAPAPDAAHLNPSQSRPPTRPQPGLTLSLFDSQRLRTVQRWTRCAECLQQRVADLGSLTHEEVVALVVDTALNDADLVESEERATPAATYAALHTYLSSLVRERAAQLGRQKSAKRSSAHKHEEQLQRFYAHQHLVVLEGFASSVASSSPDSVPAPPPSESERQRHSSEMSALVRFIQSGDNTLSISFSLLSPAASSPFFNASFGSPVHARAASYPDGREFNSASCLRALIRDRTEACAGCPSQAASFAAQMLSRQIVARSYEVADFLADDDDASSAPAVASSQPRTTRRQLMQHLWERHFVQPRFVKPWCSSCRRHTCHWKKGWRVDKKPVRCSVPGHICSSLHGCHAPLPADFFNRTAATAADEPASNATVAGVELQEDDHDLITVDVQVDGESAVDANSFGSVAGDGASNSSSVDLASLIPGAPFPLFHFGSASNGGAEDDVLTAHPSGWTHRHLLSDRTLPQAEKNPQQHPRRRQVEVLDWSSSTLEGKTGEADFVSFLLSQGRPIILRNTLVASWAAVKRWSDPTYLRDAMLKSCREAAVAEAEKESDTDGAVPATEAVAAEDAEEPRCLRRTKVSTRGRTRAFFDPDKRSFFVREGAAGGSRGLLNLSLTFTEQDLTPSELFANVSANFTRSFGFGGFGRDVDEEQPDGVATPATAAELADPDAPLVYYFGSVPSTLLPDITPFDALFASASDRASRAMFLWVSSGGVRMHAHFDQDHNIFTQVAGHKSFVLVSPEQWKLMAPFPRVHPLWHKSQADVDRPALELLRLYPQVEALEARVGPGDVLYLPPLWWHAVESASASVSLSVLSHERAVVALMEHIYAHEHKVDLLADPRGRTFALRLYIDLLIVEMYGANATTGWVQRTLLEQYRGVADLFRGTPLKGENSAGGTEKAPLCPADKIPTALHVHGDARLDMGVVSATFDALSTDTLFPLRSWRATRDLLLLEYVEELAASVVGTNNLMRFFADCFQGQGYRVTDKDSEEHELLWHSR